MYCPVVAVMLSKTPTLVSAMVLGAILLQIHAPTLFLCRILSMSCVAYQLRGHILMPMSFLLWWVAWCMPSFPPKQRMQVSLTCKKKTYSLNIQATPAQRLKWDEVMHYLNHLPEFVNEVFEDQQMENIKENFWNYVKGKFDGEKKTLRIQKLYQGQKCEVTKNQANLGLGGKLR